MTLRSENLREWKAWYEMIRRCTNPDCHSYRYYGERGIRVCKRWLNSFERFLQDMGECKPGYSLERLNVNGHYTPRNCIWIPMREQAANRRKLYIRQPGYHIVCVEDVERRLNAWEARLGACEIDGTYIPPYRQPKRAPLLFDEWPSH